jgi:hypothetical protein
MQIRSLLAACVTVLLTAPPASAQFSVADPALGEHFTVELGAVLWSPEPRIFIGSGGLNALAPNGVDFVQEFGLDTTRFTELRAVLKGGAHKFRFAKVPIRYANTAVLQRTLSFGGQTFNVSANASADLTWDLWRVGYEYDFVRRDRGLIGFIAEVKHNTVTADLRATSTLGNVSTTSEASAPIPALGVIARGYPHKNVGITVEYSGFKTPGFIRKRLSDVANFDATFKDFDLYGTVSISRFFGLQGGYRWISADYVVDDDTGDLGLKGTYFGALVRF